MSRDLLSSSEVENIFDNSNFIYILNQAAGDRYSCREAPHFQRADEVCHEQRAGGALTRGELCQDMNFQSVENGVRGIQQGLCDGFYSQNTTMLQGFNGLNTNMMNGFHGVDNAICTLGYQTQQGFNTLGSQLANCCCETQRQIERGFCDTNYSLATNTTAIIQNAHNDTDRVLNKLCEIESTRQQEKISALQNKVQSLEFAASQAAQNTYLVDQIRPCPKPAYITCNPYAYQYQNYNTGCCNQGCGC